MVKHLPCNAGDVGSVPTGETKIPHAVGRCSYSVRALYQKIPRAATKTRHMFVGTSSWHILISNFYEILFSCFSGLLVQ